MVDAGADGASSGAFVLSATPLSIKVTQRGQAVPISVHVERLGSFAGEVDVDVTGLIPGISATKAAFPPGVVDVVVSLAASVQAEQGPAKGIEEHRRWRGRKRCRSTCSFAVARVASTRHSE
jgi:hypothetical protein